MPGGRKPIEIDTAEVERLAGLGLTNSEICDCLGMAESTLYKYKTLNAEFAEAIKRGKSKAHSQVANKLFELSKEGNLGAIIWYEKTRRGMRETQDLNLTLDDLSKLSDEQLQAVAAGKGIGAVGVTPPSPNGNGSHPA